MNRIRTAVLPLLALLLGPLLAQDPAERPIEELREMALAKVAEMKGEFERVFAETSRVLALGGAGEDSPGIVAARARLGAWALAFPDRLAAALGDSPSSGLRLQLARVLADTRNPAVAGPLVALLGQKGEDVDLVVVDLLGRLSAVSAAPKLAAIATPGGGATPALRGAALMALARLGQPEAASLARSQVTDLDPKVRMQALRALAEVQASPKEDAALLVRAAQDDQAPEVREEAVRLLGRYPRNPDVLRLLHTLVSGDSEALAAAALSALEGKGMADKETSGKYLLDATQGALPVPLKERAARLAAKALGDFRGARHLVKPLRDAAEKTPKDRDGYVQAGDAYKALGAYEDAIVMYKKAEQNTRDQRKYEVRVLRARCSALLGRYDEARSTLSDYKNLVAFADDPDFQEMKAHPRYRALFEADGK